MAKAIIDPSASIGSRQPAQHHHTGVALALLAMAFLVLVALFGVDWSEGYAMVAGELMGLVAPLAVAALAAVVVYRIYRRSIRG